MAQENKAQAQAQESTAVVKAQESTLLSSIVSSNDALMERFGYSSSKRYDSNDSELSIVVVGEDGNELLTTVDDVTADEITALNSITSLQDFDSLGTIYKAWYCSQLERIAKSTGYKTVGAMVEKNVKGLSAVTVNQYARVGKLFLMAGEDGQPKFNRVWLNGVSITNLVQSLKAVKACGDDIDKFYTDYVKSGKLHIKGKLADLKKELSALDGKDSKDSKDSKESKPHIPEIAPETHLKIAVDSILAKIPSDRTKVADSVNKAYNTLINTMISLGMIGNGQDGQDSKDGQDGQDGQENK